jgi:Tfp pilus assembly protein PilN
MRPVNLLPPKHRPHQPTGGKSGSAYMVLGVLGLCLVALVTYVMESNKITQAKSDIAVSQQKTADAHAKAQQMGPFANFAQIKQQRVASVKQLADGRFDWERTVRELATVLPDGVWLQDFDASVSAAGGSTTGSDTAWAGPSIKLHGCAQKQPQVAVMMVRLREMQSVHDVVLSDSTRDDDPEKPKGGSGAPAASTDSAGATTEGCGTHNERGNYQFNAVVEFDQAQPAPAADAGKTPVRLGGGS